MNAATYAYWVAKYGLSVAKISLVAAVAPEAADHVAVWLGVGGPEKWLQAGVEYEHENNGPRVYVESFEQGKPYKLRTKRVNWGEKVTVRLFFRNGVWHVAVDRQLHPGWTIDLPKDSISRTLLETLGNSRGTATVNGKVIRST